MPDDTPTGDTCTHCGKTYAELDYFPLPGTRDWAPFCNSECRKAYKSSRRDVGQPKTETHFPVAVTPCWQAASRFQTAEAAELAQTELRNATGWDVSFCKFGPAFYVLYLIGTSSPCYVVWWGD